MAGTELTSLRSPRVVAARRLAKRAFRARERRFLAEGPQAVREALAADVAGRDGAPLGAHHGVYEVFVTRDAATRHGEMVGEATRRGVDVYVVSGEVMSSLTQTVTPQGIVAVCAFLDGTVEEVASAARRLVAVLAHVRDPGNAGTVIRTADAAGADAVVLGGESVDPYNGKCVRASAGSIFHLPLAAGVPIDHAVTALRSSRSDRAGGRRARRTSTSTGRSTRGGSTVPRPGCSATRRGGCRPRPGRSPTTSYACPSMAQRRVSTWPPPPPCASTPRRAPSATRSAEPRSDRLPL